MEDRAPGIRPRPTIGRRLDQIARAGFPACCTVLLMLISTAPWGLPMQAALLPAVTLGSVWFWSLARPTAMPAPLVFALGVLLDLLGYLPLGTGVLTLLITHGVAIRARRALQRLLAVWAAYAALALAVCLGGWAIVSGLQLRWLPLPPALFQCALTIALYPGLSVLLARAHDLVGERA